MHLYLYEGLSEVHMRVGGLRTEVGPEVPIRVFKKCYEMWAVRTSKDVR
jgi:hypothetical protein